MKIHKKLYCLHDAPASVLPPPEPMGEGGPGGRCGAPPGERPPDVGLLEKLLRAFGNFVSLVYII